MHFSNHKWFFVISLFLERISHAQQAILSACASDQFGLRMPRLLSIAASEGQIDRMPQVVQSTSLATARKVLLSYWWRITFLAAAKKVLRQFVIESSRPGKVKPYRVVNSYWYSMRGWVLAPIHALLHIIMYRGPELSIRAAILILWELVAPLSSGATSSQSLSIAARNVRSEPR